MPRWQILYAVPNLLVCILDTTDNSKLLVRTLVYIQHISVCFDEAAKWLSLTINIRKTKVCSSLLPAKRDDEALKYTEIIEEFCYRSSLLSESSRHTEDSKN